MPLIEAFRFKKRPFDPSHGSLLEDFRIAELQGVAQSLIARLFWGRNVPFRPALGSLPIQIRSIVFRRMANCNEGNAVSLFWLRGRINLLSAITLDKMCNFFYYLAWFGNFSVKRGCKYSQWPSCSRTSSSSNQIWLATWTSCFFLWVTTTRTLMMTSRQVFSPPTDVRYISASVLGNPIPVSRTSIAVLKHGISHHRVAGHQGWLMVFGGDGRRSTAATAGVLLGLLVALKEKTNTLSIMK